MRGALDLVLDGRGSFPSWTGWDWLVWGEGFVSISNGHLFYCRIISHVEDCNELRSILADICSEGLPSTLASKQRHGLEKGSRYAR